MPKNGFENEQNDHAERPKYFCGAALWPRFSSYEILRKGPTEIYITPMEGSRLDWYRPFDYQERILTEFLELCKSLCSWQNSCSIDSSPERFADSVLAAQNALREALFGERTISRIKAFCSNWGLLGTYWELTRKPYQYSREPSIARIPPAWPRAEGAPDLPTLEKIFASHFPKGNRPPDHDGYPMDAEFMRAYSEDITRCYQEIKQFWRMLETWGKFRDGNYELGDFDEESGIDWQTRLREEIQAPDVTLTVSFERGWRMDYNFRSLLSALQIMFINTVTFGNRQIKLCALSDCRRPFIAADPRAKYCGAACSNRGRQREFQAEQRMLCQKARQLAESGMDPKDISAQMKQKIQKVKRWIKDEQPV